jgi:hypothetical protein
MENINIHISKKRSVPGQSPIRTETPFDRRSGFFGVVTEVQAKNNTVTVRGDFGRDIAGVRVASSQWVTMPYDEGGTKSKDTLTGQRHLPPVNTYVCAPYSPLWLVFLKNSGEFKEILTIKN